ncbi:inositol monophosphatase family protein [Photorhabdus heterorhabditis]|uniref:inositol monophosphatase family protein n=1 Tax=Photorhabdus heterorhabditis TaxID=880156 RepID=UPI0015627298|nr:inositol monophosphatase family protein [Photorhabdus heterorhabditis]NRN27059.1 inositol monophosphatase [Photorhabdus heterorhabditis subsp. aluminescens]
MEVPLTEEIITSLVTRCTTAAREAARYLPQITSQEPIIAASKGPYREEVTMYDKELENKILHNLILADRDDGYLGEETGNCHGNSGIKWIIDPIDGTPNFVRRIPAYAISIAAEVDGKVVAGAIYDPSHQDTFTAGLGLGARCNGYKINSSNTCNLSDAIISTGFSKKPEIRRKQAKILSRLLTEVRDIRSCGSAALELCWLAAGRLDAYYEHDLCYWDLAAGSLIASEAGVNILIQDDFVIGATPAISQQLNIFLNY